MTGSIFDLYQPDIEALPQDQKGFAELARQAPAPKDNSFLDSVGDYAKTVLKGTAEGLGRLGTMMAPLQGQPIEEQLQSQTEGLNTLLPTQDSFSQNALRRGLKEAPSFMAFPGSSAASTLPRALTAGFLGEGAKELGAPELAQSALELTAYIGPEITKKLLEKGKYQDIVSFGKKMGMTDEQIAPLMQSEFKQKWLSKLSHKGESAQNALKGTKEGLGEIYNSLKKSPVSTKPLNQKNTSAFINEMQEIAHDMPAGVRNKLREDVADLMNQPITGETLMNLHADINHYLGDNAKQLARFKEPIRKAISNIDAQLGKDFQMTNDLYSKYSKIAQRLKPSIAEGFVSAAENIAIVGSLTTGYYPLFVKIVGEKTARKISQEMLTNPKFQQLSLKTVEAMNQNKYGIVKKLADSYAYLVAKDSPELASKLESLTEQEIQQFLTHHRSNTQEDNQ